jgi:hypothetical protein
LVCQHPLIANIQLAVIVPEHPQLQSLAILQFKGDMVGMAVVMTVIVMMVVCLFSHIHNGRKRCQYWRILVLNELHNCLNNEVEKQSKPNDNE